LLALRRRFDAFVSECYTPAAILLGADNHYYKFLLLCGCKLERERETKGGLARRSGVRVGWNKASITAPPMHRIDPIFQESHFFPESRAFLFLFFFIFFSWELL
jgi:hypothetical protein